MPWFARSHGATTFQAGCDATWTQTAAVPTTAPGDEALRVYQWCTNVGLVSSVLRALDEGTPSGAFVGPARFGQLRGRPELLPIYDSAANPAVIGTDHSVALGFETVATNQDGQDVARGTWTNIVRGVS